MYSDLSSDVRVLNILNTEGKKPHWLGDLRMLKVFFGGGGLRAIATSAGQNLGQPPSLIPLIIIINIKDEGLWRVLHLKETTGMRCKSGLMDNE